MLRIMSLNLQAYQSDIRPWPERREVITEMIAEASPEIVALQNVGKNPDAFQGEDQATQLSGLLPEYKTVIFRPGM